jgi:hypothetical protein
MKIKTRLVKECDKLSHSRGGIKHYKGWTSREVTDHQYKMIKNDPLIEVKEIKPKEIEKKEPVSKEVKK